MPKMTDVFEYLCHEHRQLMQDLGDTPICIKLRMWYSHRLRLLRTG